MHAAFVFEFAVNALSGDRKHDFLHAAEFRHVAVEFLAFPTVFFGIFEIHPVQFVAEKARLFSPRAAADFHDDVFIVVGILGNEQDPEFRRDLFQPVLTGVDLFGKHIPHFPVGFRFQKFLRRRLIGKRLLVFQILIDGLLHVGKFLGITLPFVHAGDDFRIAGKLRQFFVSFQHFVEFLKH